jgi:predicted RecB family endonuclease
VSDESSGIADSLTKLPQRVASVVELLTTLDQRILQALESLEQMSTSVSRFDEVGDSGDELVRDLQQRMAKLDERVHRDLDELNVVLKAKLADVDITGFNDRLDRLEQAIYNIERATVSLDRSFEGGLEMLPDFLTKRMKSEGNKEAPAPPGQMPG